MPKTLTFAQTRGTKTYHLPFQRDSLHGPEMTLMVRRLQNGSFEAGIAVCSLQEPFVKSTGRTLAYHRLNGKPIRGADTDELLGQIEIQLHALNQNRPDTISVNVLNDLIIVGENLNEAFDKLDKNRDSMMLEDFVSDESTGC